MSSPGRPGNTLKDQFTRLGARLHDNALIQRYRRNLPRSRWLLTTALAALLVLLVATTPETTVEQAQAGQSGQSGQSGQHEVSSAPADHAGPDLYSEAPSEEPSLRQVDRQPPAVSGSGSGSGFSSGTPAPAGAAAVDSAGLENSGKQSAESDTTGLAQLELTGTSTEAARLFARLDSATTGLQLKELPADPAYLVLIIDDLGYNAAAGLRSIALPGDLTFAVMPHTPHGRMLAEHAHQNQREVMLHIPMSNLAKMPLGPGALTPELEEEEFNSVLTEALDSIPHVQGLNNHMGSELTASLQPMQWLMQELREQQLYFVDSVTTSLSVAADTASAFHVPNLRRQVFLDHVIDTEEIHLQFERALSIARRDGHVVAIGHPYLETLEYLEEALPRLAGQNIQVISASRLISKKQQKKLSSVR